MNDNGANQPAEAHRRVLWRGRAVFVADPDTAIAGLLAQFARDHPDQVRYLTDEETRELAEAPELAPAPVPITWAKNLRQIRRERDISQYKLAEMAGVGRRSIIKLELGDWKPTHQTIQRISDALGVHPDSIREFAEVRRTEAERMGLEQPLPFVLSHERNTARVKVS
jgi:DNA-binding XRE family transcriptional regulator